MNLNTGNWQYALAQPNATALLKQHPQDFVVEEELGYTLTGDGEHQFLYIEKINTNTAFVAEQLAKFTGLPLRNVTYAGRKDKFALTRQWFGLHAPGQPDFDFSAFNLEGVSVLTHTRHNKKLRTGQLKGNRFTLQLRDVTDTAQAEARLATLAQSGVPNYYGEQRFGVMRTDSTGQIVKGGNLALAEKMVQGEAIRNRNKRSMAISALRSWLFNEFISARIAAGTFNQVIAGDALILSGSNSFFINDGQQHNLTERYAAGDISPSAPLWGKGELATREDAYQAESNLSAEHGDVTACLEGCGLKQERRAIKIWPGQLEWHAGGDTLTLSFSLLAGCFATSVLRECVVTEQHTPSDR